VIKGTDEAGYIVDGVRQAVPFGKKPALIIDIGGGSVEFIMASQAAILWKHSFELGTTRLLERIGMSDPISMPEQLRMSEHLHVQLSLLWRMMEKHRPNVLVGSAGSFDSLAEMVHCLLRQARPYRIGLAQDDNNAEESQEAQSNSFDELITSAFSPNEFYAIMDLLMPIQHSERLSYPGLPPYRVDTIIPALVIIDVVLQHDISQIHWSRYSMKEGVAWYTLVKGTI